VVEVVDAGGVGVDDGVPFAVERGGRAVIEVNEAVGDGGLDLAGRVGVVLREKSDGEREECGEEGGACGVDLEEFSGNGCGET
jgi:hypothetical protein